MNRSKTFATALIAAGLFSGSALAENVAIIGGKVVTGGPDGTIENGTTSYETDLAISLSPSPHPACQESP